MIDDYPKTTVSDFGELVENFLRFWLIVKAVLNETAFPPIILFSEE